MPGTLEKSAYPKNRPLHARRRAILFASGLFSYLLFLVLRWVPWVAESLYGNVVGPFLAMVLSTITGIIPLSIGELLVVGVILRYLVGGTVTAADLVRRKRQPRNAIAAGGLRLAQDIGVVLTLFYISWGFNYALPPLPERLGWSPLSNVTEDELAALATETVSATNAAYLELHGVSDVGTPTTLPKDLSALAGSLEEGWQSARERMGMPALVRRFGPPKTPLFTAYYELVGVAGYYFPFTGEVNVRAGIPALDYPQMLAHEMTHQRGVTRESEANFWGYMTAIHSEDPHAQYSALRFANRQMIVELARMNYERASELIRHRLPGVQRDIDHSREYWIQFLGPGTIIGRSVNDAFLRSNRVEGGVRSYSMSASLLLAFARENSGSLVPNPVGGDALLHNDPPTVATRVLQR